MELLQLCQNAHACRGIIGRLSTEEKNAVLETAADLLIYKEEIRKDGIYIKLFCRLWKFRSSQALFACVGGKGLYFWML